jgi:hypothetical protein
MNIAFYAVSTIPFIVKPDARTWLAVSHGNVVSQGNETVSNISSLRGGRAEGGVTHNNATRIFTKVIVRPVIYIPVHCCPVN